MVPRKRFVFPPFVWVVSLLLILVLLVPLTGCGSDKTDAATGAATGAGVIQVTGSNGTKSYSMAQIEKMPSTEGYGGMKSSTGRITPPVKVKGVLLDDLFAEVGGLPADMAVTMGAKDGYEMTFSVEQLKAGDFITYDMVTGEEKKVDGPLKVIVAYEYDGKPIDPAGEGPLRLAIVSPQMNQVTDGHWWIKWVTTAQVKPVEQSWSLQLKGKLTEEVGKATFQSCAAQGCHGNTWTDGQGNTWTGVPLYNLVGRVDDGNAHEGPAYNRDLAQAGYQVKISTADGKSAEVSSKTMYYKKDIIIAYLMNGKPLPENYWPLRLVGAGLNDSDMVGQISEIDALVPAE
jgi:DMSO/TMAO reductase YedYZ molybdopterin-dependent catalytic subunit